MSIFKDSFHKSIKEQLIARQDAINTRTHSNLTYFNSRNSWIRLSSSVNTYKKTSPNPATLKDLKDEKNYDNTLAKQFVLQGGILNSGNKRQGIGNFSNTYSNVAADGTSYRLGIRPMPGITSVEIKSKGAYGSLRDATVNFQCWDIHQLEDLEILYMRPGYTVLLEWGWSPYINNSGGLNTSVDFTDIIDTSWTKEELFKRQYARATDGKYNKEDGTAVTTTGYQGNADSMFGFVKNYSWKARMDGGYDCTTTIVSMGEVIESLKVNYTAFDSKLDINKKGLLSANVTNHTFDVSTMSNISSSYSQNILAGMYNEIREMTLQIGGSGADDTGTSYDFTDSKYGSTYNIFRRTINIKGGENAESGTGKIGETDEQIYITLESLCSLLNNYVLLRDKKSSDQNGGKSRPFAALSVTEANASSLDPVSGSGYLLALAHPVQVSIDPTVCLIKSPLWINGINVQIATGSVSDQNGDPTVVFQHNLSDPSGFVDTIICNTLPVDSIGSKDVLAKFVKDYLQGPNGENSGTQLENNIKEVGKQYKIKLKDPNYLIKAPTKSASWNLSYDATSTAGQRVGKTIDNITNEPTTFYDLLKDTKGAHLDNSVITDIFGGSDNNNIADSDPVADEQEKIAKEQEDLKDAAESGAAGSKFLDNLSRPYFIENDYSKELGIIGNIYVNINMLYNLSVSTELASQDKKEKNEIALYDYIKSVLSKISTAIGEVNTFDLFVEPDGNTARIIDVNYVDKLSANDAYNNAFQLEVHNLNSVVRSYSLESKIFPEQATIVAIGAQVGGEALGVDTTTLVDFNKAIIDRIIPVKDAPTSPTAEDDDPNKKLSTLTNGLTIIYGFFSDIKSKWYGADGKFDVDEASKYENALKDLINFFKALGKTKTKNKAIIPTVLSVDMDGIGGMIIGNLFKLPLDVLPKGYKNDVNGIGSKLGYIVTGIGHSLQNNDWVTKLEAQTIVLDEPKGLEINFSNLIVHQESEAPGAPTGVTTVQVTVNSNETVTKVQIGTNGNLPDSELKPIGIGNHKLQKEAADAFIKMAAAARAAGVTPALSDSYRTYAIQSAIFDWDLYTSTGGSHSDTKGNRSAKRKKKGTGGKVAAAFPGTSNHGWGKAIDVAGAEFKKFIRNHGTDYGWSWYEGRSVHEDWHFTYDPTKKDKWPI